MDTSLYSLHYLPLDMTRETFEQSSVSSFDPVQNQRVCDCPFLAPYPPSLMPDTTGHTCLARYSRLNPHRLLSLPSRRSRPSVFVRRNDHVEGASVLREIARKNAIRRTDDGGDQHSELRSVIGLWEWLLQGVSQGHEVLHSRMREPSYPLRNGQRLAGFL